MFKKRRIINVKIYTFTLSILVLNLIGISYACWNSNTCVNTKIYTGNIEPAFAQSFDIKTSKDIRDFNIVFPDENDDVKVIEITGEMDCGDKADVRLGYKIKNNGSLPIKFSSKDFDEYNCGQEGLKIKGNMKSHRILYPTDSNEYNAEKGKLHLEIEPLEEGAYSFQILLPYELCLEGEE